MKTRILFTIAIVVTIALIQPQEHDVSRKAAAISNAFGMELYARMAEKEEGNILFSPFSIATALYMTYPGVDGKTKEEFDRVLGFSEITPEEWGLALKKIISDRSDAMLNIANSAWLQKEIDFRSEYKRMLQEDFLAGIGHADFSSAPEQSAAVINKWVAEKTSHRIREIVAPADFREANFQTALMLVNAVYMNCDWDLKFKLCDTIDREFFVSKDESISIPMMHQKEDFKYAHVDDVKVLCLPYKGERLQMMLILPDAQDGLKDLEKRLNDAYLDKLTEHTIRREGRVIMPRFKMETDYRVDEYLKKMGLKAAFDRMAGFRNIVKPYAGGDNIWIGQVKHKVYFQVNEKGTEAAAVTVINMAWAIEDDTSKPFEFIADHPFLLLIRDAQSRAVLFLGRVARPVPVPASELPAALHLTEKKMNSSIGLMLFLWGALAVLMIGLSLLGSICWRQGWTESRLINRLVGGKYRLQKIQLWFSAGVIVVITGLSLSVKNSNDMRANEGAAGALLKDFNGALGTFKYKGYRNLGRSYPVGNDPEVVNNGKYCGLYYEVNNTGEQIKLISIAEANADCRAAGEVCPVEGTIGSYVPSVRDENGEIKCLDPVTFQMAPMKGYWFGLMKFRIEGNDTVPLDQAKAGNYYAIVAFPDEYGSTGETTFCISEEGTVFMVDFGKGEYMDTYPSGIGR